MQTKSPKSSTRWRRSQKRGVSPIIATILLVAITVVLAAVLYILISGLTKGPGNTPIGTAFALGTVNEASSGSGVTAKYYYNSTVQTASAGMTWSNMIFLVQTASGGIVAGPTTVGVTNAALSCQVATYTFATGLWTTPAAGACAAGTLGGSALVPGGAQIQLQSTTTLQSLGYKLIIVGQGSFSGTATFQIP